MRIRGKKQLLIQLTRLPKWRKKFFFRSSILSQGIRKKKVVQIDPDRRRRYEKKKNIYIEAFAFNLDFRFFDSWLIATRVYSRFFQMVESILKHTTAITIRII